MANEKCKNRIAVPLMLAIAVVLGIGIGMFLGERGRNGGSTINITGSSKPHDKIGTILSLIDSRYVDSINVDTLTEEFIPQILSKLDPHSIYMPPATAKESNESLEGQFDGIGVVFNMATDTIIIQNIVAGGPSEKVGIIAGDRIITIGDSLVAGRSIPQNDVVKMLRGPRGTKVKLGVERQGADGLIDFEVTRDKINVKSLSAAFMVDDSIGYIKLLQFSRSSHDEFVGAVKELKAKGMKSLIFDLSANTGGFLDQAILIANEFLPAGAVIVYTEGRAVRREQTVADGGGILIGTDVALLIDEVSASSSEIVAGALQDNDIGTIIGRRSYGKGLVQQQIKFEDGSALNLTIARYHTPTGRCIQRPYNDGENYDDDIIERYMRNELFSSDSIPHNDSLKYVTPKDKIVYGGGGIIPDIFVPMDTTRLSETMRKISLNNLLFSYTLRYSDSHRKELSEIKTLQQAQEFADRNGNDIYRDFIAYVRSKGIKTKIDSVTEELLIRCLLNGYILRNTPLDDNGYYYMVYPVYDLVIEAINHIKSDKE